MSIASRIQEMETHIGNAYTSIDNLGIDISNTNKNIYNISTLLDTFYESLPKVSGIGSSLSLSPTMVGKIKLNEIQGNTLQDSQPTPDTPQEIKNVTGLQKINVCGKNLFDENYTGITSDLTYKPIYVGDGAFILSTTAPMNTTGGANLFFLSGNVSSGASTGANGVYTNRPIQKQSENGYVTIAYRNTLGVNPEDYDTQLEQGSATTYEPYKGNTYEVNLGKNLFDKTLATANKRVNSNDGTIGNMNGISCSDYIDIDNATSLYLSGNTTSQNLTSYQCAFYNSNKEYISGISTTMNTIMANRQIDVPNTAKYVIFNFVSADIDKIQLELGSSATSYSPYFTPIELNKIGDYQDRIYKQDGKWYLEKNIGKAIIDGSSGTFSNPSTNRFNIDGLITDYKYDYNTGTFSLSNYYESYGQTGANSQFNDLVANVNYGFNFSSSTNTLRFKDTRYTATNDFKTWLASNNVEVLYVLATPTYTKITNTELIEDLETLYTAKSKEGTTNISITSEDLEMILNVSALKGDVE